MKCSIQSVSASLLGCAAHSSNDKRVRPLSRRFELIMTTELHTLYTNPLEGGVECIEWQPYVVPEPTQPLMIKCTYPFQIRNSKITIHQVFSNNFPSIYRFPHRALGHPLITLSEWVCVVPFRRVTGKEIGIYYVLLLWENLEPSRCVQIKISVDTASLMS